MTAAGPAASTVLSLVMIRATAVVTGDGGPAGIGPVTARAADGESGRHGCSRRHQRRTALSDFIAPFFGRRGEAEDIMKGKLSRVVRYPRLPKASGSSATTTDRFRLAF